MALTRRDFRIRTKGSRLKSKILLNLLIERKIPINATCGGRGRCGHCLVRVLKPKKPDEIESILIPTRLINKGYRLACRYHADADVKFVIPESKAKATSLHDDFGLALDIGTTIIKGAMVGLKKGRVLKKVKVYNPQNSFGGDVITRISAAINGNYKPLRNLLLSGINDIKKRLGINSPLFTTVTGNPVMLAFFLGKSVEGLAQYPFQGEIKKGIFSKDPAQYTFGIIGGFVGGDTIAGLLASKITENNRYSLYIDLGTNGEVVLVSKDKILAVSTAAGPAFEGIGITGGSLAIPGAIDQVYYKNGFKFHTIGNRKPVGICASGLLDLVATLLYLGWVGDDGRLFKSIEIAGISIEQDAIRKLQLAIGAIHTGVDILLAKLNLRPQQIEETVLTGEFGSHLNLCALFQVGLLPQGIKRVRFEQDLPLTGAVEVLLDNRAQTKAETIRRKSEHIELALEPDFQKKFVSALRLRPWR